MAQRFKGLLLLFAVLVLLPLGRVHGAYMFQPPAVSKSVATGGSVLYGIAINSEEANIDTMNLYVVQHIKAWTDTLFNDTLGTVLLSKQPDRNGDGLKGDIIVPAMAMPAKLAYFGYRVYAPDTALAFTIDTSGIYGISRLDQWFRDTAWVFTTVMPVPKVQIAPDSSDSILTGNHIDYPLTVSNFSNYPDTIDLAYVNGLEAQGWTVTLLDSAGNPLPDNNGNGFPDLDSLHPFNGQAHIIARVQSPPGLVAGTVDSVLVIASTNFTKGTKDTAVLVTTIKTVAQLTLESDAADSTVGGQTIQYPLTIINYGSASDIVDLQTKFNMSAWTRNLLDTVGVALKDNNNNGMPDIGPVPPHGGKLRFMVRVTPVPNAIAGSIDTTNVTAFSNLIPGVSASVSLKTTIKTLPAVAIAPNSADSCEAGKTVRYPLDVTNSGNGPDYINLQLVKGHPAWPMTLYAADGTTLLTDNNGDGKIDIGRPDGFGTKTQIWVELHPPANTPDSTFDTTKAMAISALRPAIQNSATLITRVYVVFVAKPGLEIGPAVQTDTTDPGKPVDYQLWVKNTGNAPDTVTLTTTGIWTDTLLTTAGGPLAYRNSVPSLGPIAPGDTARFMIRVTPPAIFGASNQTTFEQRSVVAQSAIDQKVTDTAEVDTKVVPPLTVYNYPNPFPTQTTFFFSLPEPGKVSLKVFDQVGTYIATLVDKKDYTTGAYVLPWNASNQSGKRIGPGVYVWVFNFDGATLKKAVIKKAVISQ